MTTATLNYRSYFGPACPHCDKTLDLATIRNGPEVCPHCETDFEATIFAPPDRSPGVLQLAQTGPGGASACANHARNAAVTNCDRCGLFICSLCVMDLGQAHYCPACLERLTSDGFDAGRMRFRDYSRLAGLFAVIGLVMSFILGLPLGLLSIYYAIRGIRDRAKFSTSVVQSVLVIIVAVADVIIGIIGPAAMFGLIKL
ncbi:MAG TPA: hypothetical protein VEZ11_04535 [Thermoanaerobaculia bacterium]|nr:hypothetical protein [Thermoanaerobaculia bacterium]